MRRRGLSTILVLGLVLAMASVSKADERVAGRVSHASGHTVEIDGRRALVTPDSLVMSHGRAISLGSLRRGMLAEAEIDEAGRLIELRVNRVVE